MCGIVGWIGKPDKVLVEALAEEAKVRGLHHIGYANKGKAGIIHTRYCTSGGTNQPLEINGKIMAFNGVIDMGTKKDMEARWGMKLTTDNDGEIIMNSVKYSRDILAFLEEHQKISYAGVWVLGKKFVAVRNANRPLWMHIGKQVTYIASTKDIFLRAKVKGAVELQPLKLYEWTI